MIRTVQDEEGNEVDIDVRELAAKIWAASHDFEGEIDYADEAEAYLDIRLQVHSGYWTFHTGDSQYDTDHRGLWAYGTIEDKVSKTWALEVAKDMINELKNDEGQVEDEDD